MDVETIEAVKLHITHIITESKIKEFHLDWFGGEPFMYFEQIVYPVGKLAKELCDKNNIRFIQHTTTNSVFMTDEMMEKMSEIGFTSFQIPIDGNRKHHNLIKSNADGSGTFDTIVNNINTLPKFIPNVRITMRINYDKKSLYGIEELLPLIHEDVKKNIFVDFQRVWQVKCNDEDRKRLSVVKKIFTENGLNSGYWAYHPCKFYRCYSDKRHHYAINYTGDVFKCTAQDYGKDKSIGKLLSNGNIEWKYARLARLFATDSFENERCLKCKFLPLCMGPCIIRNFEARSQGLIAPCIFKNAEYPLKDYIRDQAENRGLFMQH